MKNFTDSEYAYNKFNDGIVYRFADGTEKIITLSDFLEENPDMTESDFNALKAISDEIYLEQDRNADKQTKRNVSIYTLPETKAGSVESPEDYLLELIEADKKTENQKRNVSTAKLILDKLTVTQRRRFFLHHIKGLTYRQVGEIEGKHYTTIAESIQAAEKKIKKFLRNN